MAKPWEAYQAVEQPKGPWTAYGSADPAKQPEKPGIIESGMRMLVDAGEIKRDINFGQLSGISKIGSTLMIPIDYISDKIAGRNASSSDERSASIDQFFASNSNPESTAFKTGELASNIYGTAGAGAAVSKALQVGRYAPKLAAALESGGFSLGNAPKATTAMGSAADMATRVVGGATAGGAAAGLVDPSNAGTGAIIGGALPPAIKAAGAAGAKLAPRVGDEVKSLYEKAVARGIEIPADRIANSKPLNAAASSLNYVPMSGRAAAEEKMYSTFNRAVSKLFGQDSDNITQALRKAGGDLGGKFDVTLKGSKVVADDTLVDALSSAINKADRTLTKDGIRIIGKQVDEILGKVGADGRIDGEAAYIIKRELDDIARGGGTEANAARDVKLALMDALNRSLGPQEAAAFAKVRQQYGNMLALEKIAQNGSEGGISVARLANMKNINNPDLQELADIAAQFIRTREAPHGAAQRIAMGTLAMGAGSTVPGAIVPIAGGMAAGRGINSALNSKTLKALMTSSGNAAEKADRVASSETLRALLYSGANRGNQGGQQ